MNSGCPKTPATALVVCAVLEDEVKHFAREHDSIKEVVILEQGLHNTPDLLRERLQETVNTLEQRADIDTIVFVYGLCSRGVEGVTARRCRIVIPKGHDCITIFLGSRKRYAEYINSNPGTYWFSPGWNRCNTPPGKERYDEYRAIYMEQYDDEDTVDYLMEFESSWMREYNNAAYVDLGIGKTEEAVEYTKKCADWLKWNFDQVAGDPSLLKDLIAGNWDEDRFLILEPGFTAKFVSDECVMKPAAAKKQD